MHRGVRRAARLVWQSKAVGPPPVLAGDFLGRTADLVSARSREVSPLSSRSDFPRLLHCEESEESSKVNKHLSYFKSKFKIKTYLGFVNRNTACSFNYYEEHFVFTNYSHLN